MTDNTRRKLKNIPVLDKHRKEIRERKNRMDKTREILLKRRAVLEVEINERMDEYKAIGDILKENYNLKNRDCKLKYDDLER